MADAEAFQVMLDMAAELAPMKDAVNGHRAWAKESGYSDEVADRMALTMHDVLLALIFRGAKP